MENKKFITILAIGSRGDVQPYIALGMALQKKGARVRVATFRNFESFVTDHGLEFFPIRGDVALVAASDEVAGARQADNPLKVLLSFKTLQALAAELQQDFFEACAGSDMIVYHPGPSIGYFIAQHLNIPSVLASPFPMTPTRAFPALLFYDAPRLGAGFNYLTHKIFEQIMWTAASAPIKQYWQKTFGHAPENFAPPFGKQITHAAPTVNSCSNFVFQKPADWPEHVHNTGFWFLDEEANWQPSAELLTFLQKGAPPVYVGFGSIGDPAEAERTTHLIIDALKRAGQRGLLATGWNGMSKLEQLPADVFILESAPHAWLFPRMAAVVHHGGAGTTAAGLRAGVPNIIIPHGNDQFAWGCRVFELGVGPRPIPRKNLTAEKLSSAIEATLAPQMREAARRLGQNIQTERGAESAAAVILSAL